jgi:hypothetical protein
MNHLLYSCGSYYIVRSIFHFSNHVTNYVCDKIFPKITPHKKEKWNECVYSSLHSLLISTLSSLSFYYSPIYDSQPSSLLQHSIIPITPTLNNHLQLFTSYLSLSYFSIDFIQCLIHKKYMFLIHHIAAILLLMSGSDSFYQNDNKGFYIMYFLFLLESNTVLLNLGFILKELQFHYSITCSIWILHLFFFSLFRFVTVPKLIFMYYYLEGFTMKNIYLLPNFMLILFGSMYWSYRQCIGIHKYLKENCVL